MKRFVVVGLSLLSLVLSAYTFAQDETKQEAKADAKPEVSYGTDSDKAGEDLAKLIEESEKSLKLLLDDDTGALFTQATIQKMQQHHYVVVRGLVESFLDAALPNSSNIANGNKVQTLMNQGKLRESVIQVLSISRLNIANTKNTNRSALDFSLRNRIAFTSHFLSVATQVADVAVTQRRLTTQNQQLINARIKDTKDKLLSVVDSLGKYYVAYVKDGYPEGPSHVAWFAVATEALTNKESRLGRYLYNKNGVVEAYQLYSDASIVTADKDSKVAAK